jgi:radical SAM superfamily enzyme YgiQ (UPF0313 family)
MKKKVLYIRHAWKKLFPLNVVYLADYINKTCADVEQRIIDLTLIERSQQKEKMIKTIRDFNPDIIAYSWRDISIFLPSTEESAKTLQLAFKAGYSKKLADIRYVVSNYFKSRSEYYNLIKDNFSYLKMIKKNFPDKTLVIGGTGFSLYGDHIIENCPDGTIGIVGEGENVLKKIVCGEDIAEDNVIIKKQGKVTKGQFRTPPVDIDSFTGVDFSYMETIFPEMNTYFNPTDFIGIQTKRGCNKNCIYCNNGDLEGRNIRYRNPQAVISDVKTLNERYGVKNIWFTDSQFILNDRCIKNNSQFLQGIIENDLHIEWSSYIRIENLTKDFCQLLVQSGLSRLELSINSGSQKHIDFLKLGFDLKDIYEKCSMLKDAGFNKQIVLNYTLNIPGESKETLMESVTSYQVFRKIFGEEAILPEVYFLGVVDKTELACYLINSKYMPPPEKKNPLKLALKSAKYAIHNPPPYNALLAKLFLEAFNQDESIGKYIMENLECKLQPSP